MKRLLIFTIAATIIFTSCNSGDAKQVFKPSADTSRILATYIDFPTKDIKFGIAYQIARSAITVDSFLVAKQVTDTLFYILPSTDTTGVFKLTAKDAVCLDRNLDTAVARLSRWITANKNLWPDSTSSDSPQNNKPIK